MALVPQNQDAFFREVDEEVRRDQFVGFWERWGKLLVLAVIAALALLAAWLFLQHRRDERAGAQGEDLSAVLNDLGQGKDAGTAPRLAALAGSGDPGYAAVARIAQAGIAASKGDTRAAAAAFAAIAADAALPQPFRDLATVRQTALEFDTLPPGTVVARLAPFAAPGNPWFGSAGEMTAIARMKQGRSADAGRLFAAIARDEQVPDTIRTRAVRIAGMLGVDAVAERGGATAR